jgi:hypothetical protein
VNENRLFDIWAWSQIEAAADGSLGGESARRMDEAQNGDARLRAAVARARIVHAALGASGRGSPPAGLLGALLALPRRFPRGARAQASPRASRVRLWSTAGGAFATASLAAIAIVGMFGTHVEPPTQPELAAVHDFELALAYLSMSAAVTGREVGAALNGGLTAALEVSRESRRPE